MNLFRGKIGFAFLVLFAYATSTASAAIYMIDAKNIKTTLTTDNGKFTVNGKQIVGGGGGILSQLLGVKMDPKTGGAGIFGLVEGIAFGGDGKINPLNGRFKNLEAQTYFVKIPSANDAVLASLKGKALVVVNVVEDGEGAIVELGFGDAAGSCVLCVAPLVKDIEILKAQVALLRAQILLIAQTKVPASTGCIRETVGTVFIYQKYVGWELKK